MTAWSACCKLVISIVHSVKRKISNFIYSRGKKVFRKFRDNSLVGFEDADNDLGLFASRPDLLDTSSATSGVQSLKNPSAGARRELFPTHADTGGDIDVRVSNADEEAEEAATDIEDHGQAHEAGQDDSEEKSAHRTPAKTATNNAPSGGSPSATVRSLRHRPKHDGSEHDGHLGARKKHASPFDGWLRKKAAPADATSKSKKRDWDTVASPGGSAVKKTRGARATAAT